MRNHIIFFSGGKSSFAVADYVKEKYPEDNIVLYFTDTLWPDLDRAEIERCLLEFFKRKRRYGGLNAEDLKEEAGKKA